MNTKFDKSLNPCPFKYDQINEKVEPEKLLENCWFFGNTKTTSMYTTTTSSSYEESYQSIKKLPEVGGHYQELPRRNLTSIETKDRRPRNNKKTSSLPSRSFEDEDNEFSMGKLIRQASLKNSSDILPPRTNATKGLRRSSSISINKSSYKMEESKPIKNQLKTQKSFNDLEYEELQGFKDLGFDFDKKELSPNVVSIIPGLQEKKEIEEEEEEENTSSRRTRPYLSEAWDDRSSTPPVPKWGRKKSKEDMKMQIKFWARAVASNVRQEC